jgi:hypothetical protein
MPNGPNDEATAFLLDTMHNPQVSMRHRVDAACKLLEVHGANAFAARWVGDTSQPTFKIIIGGLPPGASVTVEPTTSASVTVERDTSAGVNDKDLDPFYVPLLN